MACLTYLGQVVEYEAGEVVSYHRYECTGYLISRKCYSMLTI